MKVKLLEQPRDQSNELASGEHIQCGVATQAIKDRADKERAVSEVSNHCPENSSKGIWRCC